MRIRLIKALPVGAALLPAVCTGLSRPAGPPPPAANGVQRGAGRGARAPRVIQLFTKAVFIHPQL